MSHTGGVILGLAIAMSALAGCGPTCPAPQQPEVGFYLANYGEVACLRRVAMVELEQGPATPQTARAMTEALGQAIGQRQLFHIEVLWRADSRCEGLPLDTAQVLSLEDLATLGRALGCDAVLLGAIRQHQVPPRMKMGLYLRLIDVRSGKLLWGVDHIWDSTNRRTVERIEDWFACEMRPTYEPADDKLVLSSPTQFQAFVAEEVAATLRDPAQPLPQPTLLQQAGKLKRRLEND